MKNDIIFNLPKRSNMEVKIDEKMQGELFDGKWNLVLKSQNLTSDMLPKTISPNIEVLNLQQNKLSSFPDFYDLPKITDLMLWNNNFSYIPKQICNFTTLQILNLGKNRLESSGIPSCIENLKNLERFWLHDNRLQYLPCEIGELRNLKNLILNNNKLTSLPQSLNNLNSLTALDLSNNNFTEFPSAILNISNLSELLLNKNHIRKIPEDIDKLEHLACLGLHENLIEILPENVCHLNFLKSLFLGYNKIKFLPRGIYLMKNLKELEIQGCPIIEPPPSVWQQGLEAIKYYQKEISVSSCTVIPRAKVMILGNSKAGKTSLCKTLMLGHSFLAPLDERTEVMENFEISINENLKLLLLDFGGHDIYNATYKLFFSPDAIYLIVFDLSVYEPRRFPTMIGFWLNAIQAAVCDAQIVLIGSHMDKCQTTQVHEVLLDIWWQITHQIQKTKFNIRKLKSYLCNISHLGNETTKYYLNELCSLEQKLKSYQNIFSSVLCVSSKNNKGVGKVKIMLSKLSESYCMKQRIYPSSWHNFEHLLTTYPTPFFVTMDICQMLAQHSALPLDQLPTVLQFLHNISIIIYHKTPKLGNIVFQKPTVLVTLLRKLFCHDWNLMFKRWNSVLTFHFTSNQIDDLEKNISTKGMVSKKALEIVLSEYICTSDGPDVVLHLLENFGFCFILPQFSQKEVVPTFPTSLSQIYQFPCYMPSDRPEEFKQFWPDEVPVYSHPFHMSCQLTDACCTIFSRLRVHLNKHLSWRCDWKTGFVGQCRFLQLYLETEEGPGHNFSINVQGRVQSVPFFIAYMSETMAMIKNLIIQELIDFSGVEFSCHISCPHCLKQNQRTCNFEVNEVQSQIQNGVKEMWCNKCKNIVNTLMLWSMDRFKAEETDTIFRDVLLYISEKLLPNQWKPLGRHLQLGDPVLDAIAIDFPNDVREQCYRMLVKWRQLFGHEAGLRQLEEALYKIERTDLFYEVCNLANNHLVKK